MPDRLPEVIYHYTTQRGLIGIITTKAIWCTDLFYFNDSSELRYSIDLIETELKKTPPAQDTEYYIMLGAILSELEWVANVNIYVSSFSEDGDLLSQWRAYGSMSSGFSIGFNSAKLREVMQRQNFRLDQCVYDEIRQHTGIAEIVRQLVSSIFDEIRSNKIENPLEIERVAVEETRAFFPTFLKFAPVLKAPYC